MVTTAGAIEEDFIKCLAPFYIGDFDKWKGSDLRKMAVNRTGNLLVPNSNYVKFEAWLEPILDKLLEEQNGQVRCSVLLCLVVAYTILIINRTSAGFCAHLHSSTKLV